MENKNPPGASPRRWTMKGKQHHGRVRLSESPLYLDLNWRKTAADTPRHVDIFPLDLHKLLEDGHIRYDPIGSKGDVVRLRIVREADDEFYVQVKKSGPKFRLKNPLN